MAITIVGTPQIGSERNGGNVPLTFDAAPEEDDIVVLFGGFSTDGNISVNPQPLEAGYTEHLLFKEEAAQASIMFGAWTKVMGATPDLSVTGKGRGFSQFVAVYGAYVLRGVDVDNILDAAITSVAQRTGTIDSPAITTLTDEAFVIAFFGDAGTDNIGAITAPSGYSLLRRSGNTDSTRCRGASASRVVASAGIEDPTDWGVTSTAQSLAATMAIRPAGGLIFPAAPDVDVSALSPTQVDLSWDEVEGADAYDVEKDSIILERVETTSYSDVELSPGTRYAYRVRPVKWT